MADLRRASFATLRNMARDSGIDMKFTNKDDLIARLERRLTQDGPSVRESSEEPKRTTFSRSSQKFSARIVDPAAVTGPGQVAGVFSVGSRGWVIIKCVDELESFVVQPSPVLSKVFVAGCGVTSDGNSGFIVLIAQNGSSTHLMFEMDDDGRMMKLSSGMMWRRVSSLADFVQLSEQNYFEAIELISKWMGDGVGLFMMVNVDEIVGCLASGCDPMLSSPLHVGPPTGSDDVGSASRVPATTEMEIEFFPDEAKAQEDDVVLLVGSGSGAGEQEKLDMILDLYAFMCELLDQSVMARWIRDDHVRGAITQRLSKSGALSRLGPYVDTILNPQADHASKSQVIHDMWEAWCDPSMPEPVMKIVLRALNSQRAVTISFWEWLKWGTTSVAMTLNLSQKQDGSVRSLMPAFTPINMTQVVRIQTSTMANARDSLDAAEKATSQLMKQLGDVMFSGESELNKMVFDGASALQFANWTDQDSAQLGVSEFAQNQPLAEGSFYHTAGGTLPSSYNKALSYLAVPNMQTDPQYVAALDQQLQALNEVLSFESAATDDYERWLNMFQRTNPGEEPPYSDWEKYYNVEKKTEMRKHGMLESQLTVADDHVKAVRQQLGANNPIAQAQDNIPTANDLWGIPNGMGTTIGNWTRGTNLNPSSVTFGQLSQEYSAKTTSGTSAAFFGAILFGGDGAGSSVFSSRSVYSVTIGWEAMGKFIVRPPSEGDSTPGNTGFFDFAVLSAGWQNPDEWAPIYTGTPPMIGTTTKALVQNGRFSEIILMYGLTIEMTLDEVTYKRLEKQYFAGVVVLGFLRIGANEKETEVNFDSTAFTVTVNQTGSSKEPFIAGVVTAPIV